MRGIGFQRTALTSRRHIRFRNPDPTSRDGVQRPAGSSPVQAAWRTEGCNRARSKTLSRLAHCQRAPSTCPLQLPRESRQGGHQPWPRQPSSFWIEWKESTPTPNERLDHVFTPRTHARDFWPSMSFGEVRPAVPDDRAWWTCAHSLQKVSCPDSTERLPHHGLQRPEPQVSRFMGFSHRLTVSHSPTPPSPSPFSLPQVLPGQAGTAVAQQEQEGYWHAARLRSIHEHCARRRRGRDACRGGGSRLGVRRGQGLGQHWHGGTFFVGRVRRHPSRRALSLTRSLPPLHR